MKTYEFVFLDADDTVFDYRASERNSLLNLFKSFNLPFNKDVIDKYGVINRQLWKKYENNEISQEYLRIERFRLLSQELNLSVDYKALSENYLEHLANTSVLMTNADQICRYLHKKYKTAIITNGISKVQRNRFEKSIIKDDIDYLIISEEAGFSKPNIGIFEYAEKITHYTNKEKMIIIGDSLSSDIMGGINYGIDTCWLNSQKEETGDEIKPTYSISYLLEVKNVL
jgi:2-haloacid dehalogenase